MPEILPNPFTDPKKLPKRSLFDRPESEKDEKQSFIDQAMAKGLEAAQESTTKKFSDPELQRIWDNIEERIETGEIKLHEIIIGGKTKEELTQEIEVTGMTITNFAKEMMENPNFKVSEEEKDLELIDLSVADLGFENGATSGQIYARAKDLGYLLPPTEVGPQLRLQYPNQAIGEHIVIGMEPLKDSSNALKAFVVGYDQDGRCLDGHYAYLLSPRDETFHFVFVRK